MILDGLTILVTGGTGSLGNAVIRRMMNGELGRPRKILIFSRDELKQHEMRVRWHQARLAIEDLRDFSAKDVFEFHIGDVRLYDTLMSVLRKADIVINAAALKQVPQCEYFPFEAMRTNVEGTHNLIRAIKEHGLDVQKVIAISTDKACKPVNVMGMTKALQERLIISANLDCPGTHFMAVRYGNVVASRGSVVPHFQSQINSEGPVTITSAEMTRFLLTLDQAVDTVFEALRSGQPGDTLVPQVPSARVIDIARAMINGRSIDLEIIGVRPGEKIHEILISEEECRRTSERNGYYVIHSVIPEIGSHSRPLVRDSEYCSSETLMSVEEIHCLLQDAGFCRSLVDAPSTV